MNPMHLLGKIVLLLLICQQLTAQKGLTRKQYNQLYTAVAESEIFQKGFTGFALFDPEEHRYLFSHQADKYFTPASNTKVLTLLTSISLLAEGLPIVFYQEGQDTLTLWGTGYPLLYHPDFAELDTLGNWLAERPESTIILATGHWDDERFGEGWSWDDYPYGYQLEKAALPIFGNTVQFSKNGHLDSLQLNPASFREALVYEDRPRLSVGRMEDSNIFTFGPRALETEELDRRIAFRYHPRLAAELLSERLQKEVRWEIQALPGEYQTLRYPAPDTLYRKLMHESNNYIAEQLILLCSAQQYGELSTERLLDYARDTLLSGLPQEIDWVDGSGLSRYNQVSPQVMINVLDQLYSLVPRDRLFDIFAAGGVSGTIENWYGGPDDKVFVYAKTGTLRHVHCLSGYILTKSGKTYLFSFMHNNFPDRIRELKEEMEQVLLWMHEQL